MIIGEPRMNMKRDINDPLWSSVLFLSSDLLFELLRLFPILLYFLTLTCFLHSPTDPPKV